MLSVATTLTDQLHDLTLKYQTLEHKHIRLQLEHHQYKQHMHEIEEQNNDLKIELAHYKEKFRSEQRLKPMLKLHLSSMQDSVTDNYMEIEQLHEQNEEYLRLIQSLRIQNYEITQQNDKCRIALERNCKQITNLKQINQNKIDLLSDEIQLLRDELAIFRNISNISPTASKSPSKASSPRQIVAMPDCSPTINFIKSLDTMPLTEPSIHFGASYISADNVKFCQMHAHARQLSFVDELEFTESCDSQWDELKTKLETLEIENAELKETIDELQCFDSDNDEMNDMEQLFQKCVANSNLSVNKYNCNKKENKLIGTYRMLFFEFKLKESGCSIQWRKRK